MKITQLFSSGSENASTENTASSPIENLELPPEMAKMTTAELLQFLQKSVAQRKASSSGTKPINVNETSLSLAIEKHRENKAAKTSSPNPEHSEKTSEKGKQKRNAKAPASSDVEIIEGDDDSPAVEKGTRKNIAKLETIAKRKIAYGIVVNFSHDEDMNWIEKWFVKLGWRNFFQVVEEEVYDALSQKPSLQGADSVTKTMGRIVKMAIMPKLGNLSGPNYNELTVLFHLKMRLTLNLPYLILNHMVESAKDTRSQSVLPYGMILTHIFKQHTVINTAAYSYTPMPRNNDIKKLLVLKKPSTKQKADFENFPSTAGVGNASKVPHSSESFLEFMLKCAVSKVDHLAVKVDLLEKEMAKFKANKYLEKSDTETFDDVDTNTAVDEDEANSDEA
ncbi:hypothetical protein L6164_025882 [Bauhinia variegata]|uniref:Uncharacterized protein n=1 Tax=Bauhinia variegata TaxID=167791 RepID=A0ACB9M1T5_BAUVA|nr:hypothetical protein L6164_025882 [Bauhinia variegata]